MNAIRNQRAFALHDSVQVDQRKALFRCDLFECGDHILDDSLFVDTPFVLKDRYGIAEIDGRLAFQALEELDQPERCGSKRIIKLGLVLRIISLASLGVVGPQLDGYDVRLKAVISRPISSP